MKYRYFLYCFIVLLTFHSVAVYANLLISPTRIAFDDRQRVAKVIVVNNSNESKTYRLEWQEKIAKPQGGYITLTDDQVNPNSLASMMRLSPSQVRLAPGERQVVKIALRKAKGLADKEYRSHLVFKALPNEHKSNSKSFGIRLDMVLSYSIPVILRQGTALPEVDIASVKYLTNDAKPSLGISLNHSGDYSSFGKVEVFQTLSGSKEEQKIAMVNDFSIYPELDNVSLTLPLFDNMKLQENSQIRITYSGLKEYQGQVFSTKTTTFTSQHFNSLQ